MTADPDHHRVVLVPTRPLHRLGLLGLALIVVTSVVCGDSTLMDLPANQATSVHYVKTGSSELNQESVVRTQSSQEEGYYQAPDAVRVVSYSESDSEETVLEAIRLGSYEWIRDARGWTVGDGNRTFLSLHYIQGILNLAGDKGFEYVGSGHTIAGEPTRRYRLVTDARARALIEGLDRDSRSSPECAALNEILKDALRGMEDTYELVRGEKTGYVYSMVNSFAGPNASGWVRVSFDQHDVPVEIEPPTEVQPSPVRLVPPPEATQPPPPCATLAPAAISP